MEYIIRPIAAKDNAFIAKVIRSILEEHAMNKPGTVYTDPTTDNLFELFQETGSAYFIVEKSGKIMGGCGLYPTKGLPDGCAELVKLYLAAEMRGLGLGKELMLKTAEVAKTLGYHQLYLESMPELNSAVGLYESLGYQIIDKPLGDSGHFACNLWMLKQLN